MVRDLRDFHYYVGETIMFCQCIEQDIKFIYAGMLSGDFDENYKDIEECTLGQAINKLQQLDYSDNDPYFSKEDYTLFKRITNIRNHWAHKAYTTFVYEKGYSWEESFTKAANRLENEHNRLRNIHSSVEKVRLTVLREYNRL